MRQGFSSQKLKVVWDLENVVQRFTHLLLHLMGYSGPGLVSSRATRVHALCNRIKISGLQACETDLLNLCIWRGKMNVRGKNSIFRRIYSDFYVYTYKKQTPIFVGQDYLCHHWMQRGHAYMCMAISCLWITIYKTELLMKGRNLKI